MNQEHVMIPCGAGPFVSASIAADLTLANEPGAGICVFAHGSGSSRKSPRNLWVAEKMQYAGFSTLLVDLLTSQEQAIDEGTAALRFDIDRLAKRLVAAIDWIASEPRLHHAPIGLFGASTGAAAALVAAADRPKLVSAIVSRGGRPDLARPKLPLVRAPTLLIVGGSDVEVLMLNQSAALMLPCEHTVSIVHGATHLFEEPGALEQVARLAQAWFERHLGPERLA